MPGASSRSPLTDAAEGRTVVEQRRPGAVPLWSHPEWDERFSWLVQGTTGRGDGEEAFDLGLFGSAPVGEVQRRWRLLQEETAMRTAIHSHQVHGALIGDWLAPLPAGRLQTEGQDGHITDQADVLLTASIADCVPVFLVGGEQRVIAVLHAGWRGVAAGIVEVALERVGAAAGGAAGVWLHTGPSICGECYEVGPEVHEAVNPGDPIPTAPTPIDLRTAITRRAVAAGVTAERITRSGHCTRCGPGTFFSHRGGSPQRQLAVVGRRR